MSSAAEIRGHDASAIETGAEAAEAARCLNCGADLAGAYCAACGQARQPLDVRFGDLLRELLAETFNWDSKLLRTARTLLLRPGVLTREYIDGRRAAWVSPFRLYLLSGIVFVVATALSPQSFRVTAGPVTIGGADSTAAAPGMSPSRPSEGAGAGSDAARATVDSVGTASRTDTPGAVGALQRRFEAGQRTARSNPDLARQVWIRSWIWAMLLMTPVFAMLLKLLYLRSRIYYVRHLVFAVHYTSIAFIAFSALLLAYPLSGVTLSLVVTWSILAWLAVHLVVGLHRVYRQPMVLTLVKAPVLALSYIVLVGATAGATAVGAVLWLGE